jgi:hypothetical protein
VDIHWPHLHAPDLALVPACLTRPPGKAFLHTYLIHFPKWFFLVEPLIGWAISAISLEKFKSNSSQICTTESVPISLIARYVRAVVMGPYVTHSPFPPIHPLRCNWLQAQPLLRLNSRSSLFFLSVLGIKLTLTCQACALPLSYIPAPWKVTLNNPSGTKYVFYTLYSKVADSTFDVTEEMLFSK